MATYGLPGSRKHLTLTRSPNWVEQSLVKAKKLGAGTYAWVWETTSGTALKITLDPASAKLCKLLLERPCKGLPEVYRVSQVKGRLNETGELVNGWAIEQELLLPLSSNRSQLLLRAYRHALRQCGGCPEEDPQSFSMEVLQAMPAEFLRKFPKQVHLAGAFSYLHEFIQEHGYCIDLLHEGNWMESSQGLVVMCDPVVAWAVEF